MSVTDLTGTAWKLPFRLYVYDLATELGDTKYNITGEYGLIVNGNKFETPKPSSSQIYLCTTTKSGDRFSNVAIFTTSSYDASNALLKSYSYYDNAPNSLWEYTFIDSGGIIRSGAEGLNDTVIPTLKITGGADATNPTLIAWLESIATQVGPKLSYDLSRLNLPSGTYTITAKAKKGGIPDSPASNAVTYTVS